MNSNALYIGIIELIVLWLSLSVHESAHAWTANRLGDPTAKFLGRVSLNPIVHIDPIGTLLLPILGMLYGGIIFGWAKPVPVSVNRLNNPKRDYMLVSAAGPISNFLLAALSFLFLMILKFTSPESAEIVRDIASGYLPTDGGRIIVPLVVVAVNGITLNVVLGVFNLIPIAPLDGSGILSGILPRPVQSFLYSIQSYGMIIIFVLVFMGIPAYLYSPVIRILRDFLTA
jgi:Zn-dependent protease